MFINHIALYAIDLEKERAFYEKYFDGRSSELYTNPRTGFSSYFISFESGAKLEIMSRPETVREYGDAFTTGYTHLAFSAGCREAVDYLAQRLARDKYMVIDDPKVTGDNRYECNVMDPEGNIIEITL